MSAMQTQLINTMACHYGRAKGIPARELAHTLGLSMRALRRQITAARETGIPICGTPGTGYYMPADDVELEQACEFLKNRALHSLKLMSVMRRVAMPTLVGQLLLSKG